MRVRGARNNGLSETAIRETTIHATTYCGVPPRVDAFKTAAWILDEIAEKEEMKRESGKKVTKE